MTFDEILLFPTVIHQYDLKDHPQFARLQSIAEEETYESVRLLAATTYTNRQQRPRGILGHPELALLANTLDQLAQQWSQQVGCRPIRINHSWLNQYAEGDRVERHRHEMSVCSAALFVQADADSCGLRFHSPLAQLRQYEISSHTTFYNENFTEIAAVEGRLVIFPSWLEHDSQPNASSLRRTLSFNTQYQE